MQFLKKVGPWVLGIIVAIVAGLSLYFSFAGTPVDAEISARIEKMQKDVGAKADLGYVTAELGTKADAMKVVEALAGKADVSQVTDLEKKLALKADKSEVVVLAKELEQNNKSMVLLAQDLSGTADRLTKVEKGVKTLASKKFVEDKVANLATKDELKKLAEAKPELGQQQADPQAKTDTNQKVNATNSLSCSDCTLSLPLQ